jgi:hypothetical protein
MEKTMKRFTLLLLVALLGLRVPDVFEAEQIASVAARWAGS